MMKYTQRILRTYSTYREGIELNNMMINHDLTDSQFSRLKELERRCDEQDEKGLGIPEIIGGLLAITRHPVAYFKLQIFSL